MKKLKIFIGFLFLFGSASEYIRASKQFLSFLNPGIIIGCTVMIFFCAWLLGSGFSKEKFEIRSYNYAKYLAIAFIVFLFFSFFSLITYKAEPLFVKVNGLNIDISQFMDGSKRIIPDEKERFKYCTCVVTQLAQDKYVFNKYYNNFKEGRIDIIISEINTDTNMNKLKLHDCISPLENFNWTSSFEQGMRKNILTQLKQSGFSTTNNIDTYCDCLIMGYKKIGFKEVSSSEFFQSENAMKLDSVCNNQSKLK